MKWRGVNAKFGDKALGVCRWQRPSQPYSHFTSLETRQRVHRHDGETGEVPTGALSGPGAIDLATATVAVLEVGEW